MLMRKENLPKGSREEEKRVSYIDINGEKYRMIYAKAYGDTVSKDILKIEVSTDFIKIVPYVKDILEEKMYNRIHLFVKYAEFLKLEISIEEIDRILMCTGYDVKFVYIPKEYKRNDYILMYDIKKIETPCL
ncbi:hypothetical protein NGRA_2465 [Nosema granulosis]|uniref:Uncharacterized protein n=1 Tax=Nosema granulosis TaxID=83296 RepID=A0A9P6GX17_9MICR|nr:hypothetical protein NGRA_2465 [Nosema granulosis]